VKFQRLGLTIIDEQHRFGVNQRASLKFKGLSPHYLVLSATPIPRTQAMAWLGYLDVSVIDELPAGRGRIYTHLVQSKDEKVTWREIRKKLDYGEQGYIVFPLIEESEKLPLKAVTTEFQRLRNSELRNYKCQLLHGRMNSGEKEKVISGFERNEVQVLVSTTVVEVGVDIPNATMMAVFHADRYGLAQLHQLRGRVGRGCSDAHFFMLTDSKEETALQRLHTLVETTDGFKIAEADFQQRGTGELLGTQQHGLPRYRFANLLVDKNLLAWAQKDAWALINKQIELDQDRKFLLEKLQDLYGESKAQLMYVA